MQQMQQHPRETGKPGLPYWHVWTDENGVSRQDRCTMSNFEFSIISSGAAPLWIDRMDAQPAHVVLLGGRVAREPGATVDYSALGPLVRGDHGRQARGDGAGRAVVRQ